MCIMKPSNILSLAFSLLISRGASQTTTAPAGSPEDVPPTRTVYSYTGTYYSGFPCAGQALAQSTASTYPVGSKLSVSETNLDCDLIYTGFRLHYHSDINGCVNNFLHLLVVQNVNICMTSQPNHFSTETFVRSDATPNPPTFTSYLNTVTSTSSIVCGGCEILSLDPGNVYPVVGWTVHLCVSKLI